MEVSIQAVSPELPTHLSVTLPEHDGGGAGVGEAAGVAAAAGDAAGAAAAAAAAGLAEAEGAGVAMAEADGAGVAIAEAEGDGVCAMLGSPNPISAAIASAGARPERYLDSFIFLNSTKGKDQSASSSFSPVRMRTADSSA